MKRILIATALTTTLSTAAFAVTDGQLEQIESFASGIDTSVMTEDELLIAYGIVMSGDSRSEKIAKLRGLETGEEPTEFVVISEATMLRLMDYAPNADLALITQSQAETALAVTYSGLSEGDKRQRVQAILNDYTVIDTMAGEISEGRLMVIETFAPEIDIDDLSEEDVLVIMTFIHSGMSRGEKLNRIQSIAQG